MADYSNYTIRDICIELFNFTDALQFDGKLSEEEIGLFADLREQFYKRCSILSED